MPFVQPANSIFTADAEPMPPSIGRTSSTDPAQRSAMRTASSPLRYIRVVPGRSAGGPTMPPSTKRSKSAEISRVVAGDTALAST